MLTFIQIGFCGIRDGRNHWEISEADETYIPYIPQGLPFGGRTAPLNLKVTDTHIYLLWRSGLETSPIILKSIGVMDENIDDIQVLGELGDEPFSASPSFVMDFSHSEFVGVLWKQSLPAGCSVSLGISPPDRMLLFLTKEHLFYYNPSHVYLGSSSIPIGVTNARHSAIRN